MGKVTLFLSEKSGLATRLYAQHAQNEPQLAVRLTDCLGKGNAYLTDCDWQPHEGEVKVLIAMSNRMNC